MIRTNLFPAFCALALLAAPALAQTPPKPSPAAAPASPAAAPASPAAAPAAPAAAAAAAPAAPAQQAAASKPVTEAHVTHKTAVHHTMQMAKTDTSQDAAVDALNEQSYQSAEKGQAFTGTGAMSAPADAKPATKKM